MKRPELNLLVDAAAFAAFVLLTSTGVLMRWVLPPGSGRHTTLWGWDRHAWGQLHFGIALALLAILAGHLVLHRRWIVSVVRGQPRERGTLRVALGAVGLLALLATAAAPFFVDVETTPRGGRHQQERPPLERGP